MSEPSEDRKTEDAKTSFESLPPEDILHTVVDDYEQVKIIGEELASDIGRNILTILHDDALTASEVAKKYSLSRQLIAYHLERLERAGLVQVKEIDFSEKGKEMKRYHVPKMALLIIFPNILENKEKAVIQLKKIAVQSFIRRLLMSIGTFALAFGSLFGVMQSLYREVPARKEPMSLTPYEPAQAFAIAIIIAIVASVLIWLYLKRRR